MIQQRGRPVRIGNNTNHVGKRNNEKGGVELWWGKVGFKGIREAAVGRIKKNTLWEDRLCD